MCESCVTGDTLVSTDMDIRMHVTLQIGMKVRTPAGLKPIEKIYNNGPSAHLSCEFFRWWLSRRYRRSQLKVVRGKKYPVGAIAELTESDKVLVLPNETFGPRQSLQTEAMGVYHQRELNVANFYDRKLGLIVGTVLGDAHCSELSNGNSHLIMQSSLLALMRGWYDTFTI